MLWLNVLRDDAQIAQGRNYFWIRVRQAAEQNLWMMLLECLHQWQNIISQSIGFGGSEVLQ